MARRPAKASFPVAQSELSRDVYGFAVRPQLLERYKEYAVIYKEEEAERSARWERFLMTYGESASSLENHVSADTDITTVGPEQKEQIVNDEVVGTVRNGDGVKWESGGSRKFETWGQVRSSLWPVERVLRSRFKKNSLASGISDSGVAVLPATELEPSKAESSDRSSVEGSGDESEEEFYDVERSDGLQDGAHGSPELLNESNGNVEHEQESCPWKQELDALVRGGVPMALRGELWQVFVGTTTRRVQGHYQALLTLLADGGGDSDGIGGLYSVTSTNYSLSDSGILEKWTSQIEKDLPRTFPGHPALDEDGRNALRHLLTAYARHNPDVGYCQAMNFFAALLLLMMPEENAFWTLTGIIGEYFEGYYSETMLESQVDQLILEDLVRKHFPKLVHHLDNVGVQVAWVSGPWFLSIFVNILPWESVLRVWDVLLYEGNRSILFRTALALIELHGSAIMATKDAGDAVATLQTLAGSTFDSSQLVLVACMGYQSVNESKLQELAVKYRPQVLAALSERSMERSWHGANGTALVSQKSDAVLNNAKASIHSVYEDGDVSDGILDAEENSAADLVEQVKWLKMELSRALEESRAATVRAEELENAFMELVKEDNRRLLSAKVETLEAEVAQLRQALVEKEEQENAMVQVMLRMEHEQRLAEDARRYAEKDATAQREATSLLQAKYEDALISLSKMEERTVMAETMLEATLQYQALDNDRVGLSKRSAKSTCEEDSSRWSWPRISPKSIDSSSSSAGLAGSTFSRKLECGDLVKEQLKSRNADPSLVDLPEKQGVLSRRFSLNWLEKPKGKIGTSNTQMVLSPSVQGSEHDSSFSSVSLSPQDSLDSSQITSLCQDESHGNTDASTLGELSDSIVTHPNIKISGK